MNYLNKSFFNLLVIAILATGADYRVFAQSPVATPLPCPSVMVSSPDSGAAGQPLTYTANISGGDPKVSPTYNWSISGGTISSGQGTSSITVDTKDVPGDSAITATVDVGGYDRQCSTSSSSTAMIMKAAAESQKFDEYGAIKPKDEQARLDTLAIELQNDPTTQSYIFTYAGRKSKAKAAQKSATTAKNYLVKKRGIATARLIVVDGGYRDDPMTELWIVPNGATPPAPSPTVDPSELKKPASKKSTGKKS